MNTDNTHAILAKPTLTIPVDIFDGLDIKEATREEYKSRLPIFLSWLSENEFNRNSLLEFKRFLEAHNDLAATTKNKYLVTARIFLQELCRRGLIPDITSGIKGFRQGKRHKRDGLSDKDIDKLTAKLRELPDTPAAARLKALFCLLAFQGLRQIEIVRLDVQDINLSRRVALVRGKGSDDTEPVHLHPQTTKALRDYLKLNRLADGPLFVSISNNRRNQRLTTRAIRSLVHQMIDDLGIDNSTHGFRHYFTTKLIKTYKGDLLEVRQYTRHNSLEMLQIYNDSVKQEEDLPRFYGAFDSVKL